MTDARRLAAVVVLAVTGGCATQHDILFMTKSNVGLDMDTTPPTAEISIARREIVIAPSFEGGAQPPVLATFRSANGQKAASTFAFGGSSTFVGGKAAVLLARNDDTQEPSPICLSAKPTHMQVGKHKEPITLPDSATLVPFLFGTDTSLGLKIGYSGTSVAIDSIRLGFNRKEFAKAPIVLKEIKGDDDDCPRGTFQVAITSFYAGIERDIAASAADSGPKTDVRLLQAFATGEAAEEFVQKEQVRRILLARLEPEINECVQAESQSVTDIGTRIDTPEKTKVLMAYLERKKIDAHPVAFMNCVDFEDARQEALEDTGLDEELQAAGQPPPPNP